MIDLNAKYTHFNRWHPEQEFNFGEHLTIKDVFENEYGEMVYIMSNGDVVEEYDFESEMRVED